MQIEFKVYGALCEMETFIINGVDADKDDFGTKQDESPETAEDYACGDMRFTRKPSTPAVLSKYGITEKEHADICEKLEDGLSFGCCGWCV
jgi:hypothetical protein